MIDTDKYEGHTPGPWKIYYDKWNKTGWWIDSIAQWEAGQGDTICQLYGKGRNKDPTAKLIAAAPELLAEVKRLRDLHILACDYLQSISDGTLPDNEWPHIHAMIRGDDE